MSIPRSTRTGRGELAGAADAPRQVRSVRLRVEQLGPGMLRVSQETTPGWAAVAKTPVELARAVAAGFREAQVAAYSAWRGDAYDGDVGTSRRPAHRKRPAQRAADRSDTYDPRAWRLADDGMWVSPAGRRYPAGTRMVEQVMARRRRMCLPDAPEPVGRAGFGREAAT